MYQRFEYTRQYPPGLKGPDPRDFFSRTGIDSSSGGSDYSPQGPSTQATSVECGSDTQYPLPDQDTSKTLINQDSGDDIVDIAGSCPYYDLYDPTSIADPPGLTHIETPTNYRPPSNRTPQRRASQSGTTQGHVTMSTPPSSPIPPPRNRTPPPDSQDVRVPTLNPIHENPPCNTLFVGNLPVRTSADELKTLFSRQPGFQRQGFYTKEGRPRPMCFVQFQDIAHATRALDDLYGHNLSNSTQGGIRLSFSKNPLGVRSDRDAPVSDTP